MDEPTTYLDVRHQLEVMAVSRRLADMGRAVVLVLHDLSLALREADRLAVLSEGTLRQLGTPEEVFSHSEALRALGLDIPVSTAVALGIFVATLGGGSFTKYNKYLIGDILSVTPGEIGLLALVLLAVLIFWVLCANRLTLTAIHPQLASSRGIPVGLSQTLFTVAIAVVVTLSISSVGLLILNSLLVLPAASARNVARNLREYHLFSVVFALIAGLGGLTVSYYLGSSAGAAISLLLALVFGITFAFRKVRG